MPERDPFSDIDRIEPVAAADRRRSAPRRRTLKTASIARLDNMTLISCTLRDLSDTGARLRCADQASVPKEFHLMFPSEGWRVQARVTWRRGDEVGVSFTGQKEPMARRKG
jgi:two-component system cell cycle response regulator